MKECEEESWQDGEGNNDVEEKEKAYGSWMRASPILKIHLETKKELNSLTCSKSFFSSTSMSNCSEAGNEKTSRELLVKRKEVPSSKNPSREATTQSEKKKKKKKSY